VGDKEVVESQVSKHLVGIGGVGLDVNILRFGIRLGQVVPSRVRPNRVKVGLPQDEGANSDRVDSEVAGWYGCKSGLLEDFSSTNCMPYILSARPTMA